MIMAHRPLFSIATPCYNSEKTIERTIKSVLQQEFKDYEYIIVDGGSTDGTLEIIKKYEPLFEGRMKWKSEPDKGIYDAFNKGVQRSSGCYCWNVNSDDWIEPDALEKISKCINNKEEIIVGGVSYYDLNGNKYKTTIPTSDSIQFAYRTNRMIPHPATIVPKKVYEKYGCFDLKFKIAGDMDWFHRVYPQDDINFYPLGIVINNMSDGGVSTTSSLKKDARERWLFYRKKYSNPFSIFGNMVIWFLRYIMK